MVDITVAFAWEDRRYTVILEDLSCDKLWGLRISKEYTEFIVYFWKFKKRKNVIC
jgi:hypothetical protein